MDEFVIYNVTTPAPITVAPETFEWAQGQMGAQRQVKKNTCS